MVLIAVVISCRIAEYDGGWVDFAEIRLTDKCSVARISVAEDRFTGSTCWWTFTSCFRSDRDTGTTGTSIPNRAVLTVIAGKTVIGEHAAGTRSLDTRIRGAEVSIIAIRVVRRIDRNVVDLIASV